MGFWRCRAQLEVLHSTIQMHLALQSTIISLARLQMRRPHMALQEGVLRGAIFRKKKRQPRTRIKRADWLEHHCSRAVVQVLLRLNAGRRSTSGVLVKQRLASMCLCHDGMLPAALLRRNVE